MPVVFGLEIVRLLMAVLLIMKKEDATARGKCALFTLVNRVLKWVHALPALLVIPVARHRIIVCTMAVVMLVF